jgi:hypothetical protein
MSAPRIPRRCETERAAGKLNALTWNEQHPVGTRVRHRDPFGRVTDTHTTARAWALITGRLALPLEAFGSSVLLDDCEIVGPPVKQTAA